MHALPKHGLVALYLFGSRADEGLRVLAGEALDRAGSDIEPASRLATGQQP